MTFAAYHLPGFRPTGAEITLERDDFRAVAPQLSPDDVRSICGALRAAHDPLQRLPVSTIIGAIDDAARRLRDPAAAGYDELISGIAAFTGYSRPMATHVLERMSADWLAQPLEQLVRAELGDAAVLDSFGQHTGGRRARAIGPPLSFHVFAGNVPGVSVTSIVRALLVKSAVFGKSAAGEPLLAPTFARRLAEADPDVGAAVAIAYWPGGDTALEHAALGHADTVIHYGSAAAVESLRARAPARVRFLEHGPRFSCAIVHGDFVPTEAGDRAAHDLARSVALFDQQGCVSPQAVYVVGGGDDAAHRFAERVAVALEAAQQLWPRGRIETGEATAIRELRTRAEFRAIAGDPVQLWTGEPLAWTVVLDPEPHFTGSCLNRTLLVKPVSSADDVLASLRPLADLLQTVGIAGFAPDPLLLLAAALANAGATRITSIADMPWPPVTWHHDGRGPLLELVRWVDWENFGATTG